MRFYDQLINESAPGALQAVPAVTNVPSGEYPRAYADGRVTFRVHLPQAKSVRLEGGQGLFEAPIPMTRDADGNWTVTLAPTVMGLHYYWFDVERDEDERSRKRDLLRLWQRDQWYRNTGPPTKFFRSNNRSDNSISPCRRAWAA